MSFRVYKDKARYICLFHGVPKIKLDTSDLLQDVHKIELGTQFLLQAVP